METPPVYDHESAYARAIDLDHRLRQGKKKLQLVPTYDSLAYRALDAEEY